MKVMVKRDKKSLVGEGGALLPVTLLVFLSRRHRTLWLFSKQLTASASGHYSPRFFQQVIAFLGFAMASRSPTAMTPLPKSSVAPESPAQDATALPQTVPFPPPQTFEIIPPLHGILLRLLSQKAPANTTGRAPGDTTGVSGTSTDAHTQDQQGPSDIPGNRTNVSTVSQIMAESSSLNPNVPSSLDLKTLPTETSSVKIRIQKARAVVEGLPDVHRSVDEQQKEIDELEDRVARLRSVIADFGAKAAMK